MTDHNHQVAVVRPPVVMIPRGTRLRITRFDERWDNSHASIMRFGEAMASLRVLDGPGEGAVVAVSLTGEAVPNPDGGESEVWHLPGWLVLVDADPTGGR